jgi:GxxExxY protein
MNHEGTKPRRKGLLDEMRERTIQEVVDAAFTVHRELGPGLLESIYEACLCEELSQRAIRFQRQLHLPILYKEQKLDTGFRIDFFVEGFLGLELKAVDQISDLHKAQVLTYLKLSKQRVGLLINFNVSLFKEGIRRLVL